MNDAAFAPWVVFVVGAYITTAAGLIGFLLWSQHGHRKAMRQIAEEGYNTLELKEIHKRSTHDP